MIRNTNPVLTTVLKISYTYHMEKPYQNSYPKNLGGRPKDPAIDWDQVKTLAELQCTPAEIAAVLKVPLDKLERICTRTHKIPLSLYLENHSQNGKVSLRRKLFSQALTEGSEKVLIFLAKNYLGMSEKEQITCTGENGAQVQLQFNYVPLQPKAPEEPEETPPVLDKLEA